MFFSFGCWLNFSTTLGKISIVGKKKKRWNYIFFCFSGFWARKICRPSALRVRGDETDNEKHIAEIQTGWREKKRGERGGDELGWNRSKFPSIPPPFLLNTEKCTFFPCKSASTVCFCKNIFHWQSHGCLHSVITRMEGKRHLFAETIPEETGARGFEVVGLLRTTALHPTAFWFLSPKIDSHIVLLFFFFLLTTMALTPISLTNFYRATKHRAGTPVKPSWTWKHVYEHGKKRRLIKMAL